MLHIIGNEHSDQGLEHDDTDFTSSDLTKFVDNNKQTMVISPITQSVFGIAVGGVVFKVHEIDVVQNKYIRINGEFIASFLTYFNKTRKEHFNINSFKELPQTIQVRNRNLRRV